MTLIDFRKIPGCFLLLLLVSCGGSSDSGGDSAGDGNTTTWDVSGKAFLATILFGDGGFPNEGNFTIEFFTDTYSIIGGTGVPDSSGTYTIDLGGTIYLLDGSVADKTCLWLWSGATGSTYNCSQPGGSTAGSYTEIASRTSAHAIERLSDNIQ